MKTLRTNVILVAAGAIAPWPLAFLAGETLIPAPLLFFGCFIISAAALALLAQMLRPVAEVAESLAPYATPDGSDDEDAPADDLELIARGAAGLIERVQSLHHRWVWRHPVTGMPIRESLALAIATDLREGAPPTLIGALRFVDHDRLAVFDPAVADEALKGFAERLSSSLGPSRPFAHVDRDCFAIWFRGSAETARIELQALCYALGAELTAGTMKFIPEIEIGAALYPSDGQDSGALINHAVASLARPGNVTAADPVPGRSAGAARERFALEQDLRHAIERGQFELAFQPVVDLSKGALVGAEALLRWRHPDEGMIPPSRFIPILEDADLIDEIGRWTLNAACKELRRWQKRGLGPLTVAVNLSANQLRDSGLGPMIKRTLAHHKLGPGSLELELTETAATEDKDRTFALFGDLREHGVSIAIDDFGSGYSSLSYLKNLPFDKLKIDREFVTDVHLRKDSQAICRSLIELTRGLGIQVLAEGVETLDEVEMLRHFGCSIFQGYFFARPMTSDQFVKCVADPAWQERLRNPVARAHQEIERKMSA